MTNRPWRQLLTSAVSMGWSPFEKRYGKMPAKRMLFAILVASIVALCVGLGSGPTGTALALPPVSQHSPSGLTIPNPGRLTGNTGAPVADALTISPLPCTRHRLGANHSGRRSRRAL